MIRIADQNPPSPKRMQIPSKPLSNAGKKKENDDNDKACSFLLMRTSINYHNEKHCSYPYNECSGLGQNLGENL